MSKVTKSSKPAFAKAGPSGKVGKQGSALPAKSGKVAIAGNTKGGGKFAKAGPSGKVGSQKPSYPAKSGKVSVAC